MVIRFIGVGVTARSNGAADHVPYGLTGLGRGKLCMFRKDSRGWGEGSCKHAAWPQARRCAEVHEQASRYARLTRSRPLCPGTRPSCRLRTCCDTCHAMPCHIWPRHGIRCEDTCHDGSPLPYPRPVPLSSPPVVGVCDHAVAVEHSADVLLRPVAAGLLRGQQEARAAVQGGGVHLRVCTCVLTRTAGERGRV